MIRAWHFVGDRLRDGRAVPKDGVWLEHQGAIRICASGLHASRDLFDALKYAPGPILCLVDCDGDIAEQSDKLVCRRRRIVQRLDATEGLLYFARMQALSVVHLWAAPEVVLDYLMTGDDRLRATAWDAARAAASAAARAAASAAARAAAWDAARATAMAAAMDARATAWDAAWAAARATARATDAPWAAAMDAAAMDAARREWNDLVSEAFGLERVK